LSSPNNNDLSQLSAAMRFMRPQYVIDSGVPNHLIVMLNPPPALWAAPLTFFVQIGAGNGNTQPAVDIEIEGIIGAVPLVKRSGQVLAIGDLVPGCSYLLTYDGFKCRCVSTLSSDWPPPGSGGGGIIDVTTGDRDYYINPTTGNDSNDGATAGTAWKTLQYAYNYVQRNIDLAGYKVTFHCADGTYPNGLSAVGICRGQAGPGAIVWQGNSAAPANALVSTNTNMCFGASSGAKMTVNGFKVQQAGNYTAAVNAEGSGSEITIGPMEYGPSGVQGAGNPNMHIRAGGGATVNCVSSYTISGGAAAHQVATANGNMNCIGLSVSIFNNPYFNVSFVNAQENGTLFLNDILNHTNLYSGAVQGSRYSVGANGVIFVYGAGANYLPGTVGGTQSYGGQYV
jgi:hypothetical protein